LATLKAILGKILKQKTPRKSIFTTPKKLTKLPKKTYTQYFFPKIASFRPHCLHFRLSFSGSFLTSSAPLSLILGDRPASNIEVAALELELAVDDGRPGCFVLRATYLFFVVGFEDCGVSGAVTGESV
jgi:hypothetical protein